MAGVIIEHLMKTNFKMLARLNFTKNFTTVHHDKGIKIITLDYSKKRNALSLQMLKKLKQDLLDDSANPDLRCVILRGNGPVFSSGHDLKELTSKTGTHYHKDVFKACSEVMTAVRNLPVPVIAEIKGMAAAAGFQLAASCDIVIASKDTKFFLPGADVGLFCSTPGIAVARMLPKKVTSYLLFTGLPITSEEAFQCGFVSKVVQEEELEKEAMKIANAICSKSRAVVELGKSFYYKQIEMDVQAAYREGEKVMTKNLQLKDAQEGINAFLEKRKPQWTHTSEKIS